MKLDTTKVYYLGDLSDEQKRELLIRLRHIDNALAYRHFCPSTIYLMYSGEWYEGFDLDDMREDLDNNYPLVNALTLFTQTKDERIAQIQLRIQELNNELIELDEEMRKLTYDKKEN